MSKSKSVKALPLICRSRILREGGQILVGESEVFDQRPECEALVAKVIVTLRSIHQSKIKPAPHLKGK